ncbi:MAG: tryptophan-rich sensory protein [Rubrobacter sp.]|nr:tryptophan-rich sensory protein [Rubrobacter sp.]
MIESFEKRIGLGGAGRSAVALVVFFAACFLAAGGGGLFTAPQTAPGGWYDTLDKPFFTPPDWLFGPVWTVLYAAMALAAWIVWRKRSGTNVRPALVLFGIQLFLNMMWSVVFFGMEAPGWRLLEISALWVALSLTIAAFMRVSRLAGWLLVPYLAWETFATFLNAGIWLLN